MKQYVIHVGLRNESDRKTVERIVGEWFEGATIVPSRGLWKGAAEDSNVVEILIGDAHMKDEGGKLIPRYPKERAATVRSEDLVFGLAFALQDELGQENVLVDRREVEFLDGMGIESHHWTFKDRMRNWVVDRNRAYFHWCRVHDVRLLWFQYVALRLYYRSQHIWSRLLSK